jgi:hypothetical protein
VFLGNPCLSKPEQVRVRAVFDRAQRVLAEIDAADADPDEEAAHADTGQDGLPEVGLTPGAVPAAAQTPASPMSPSWPRGWPIPSTA